MNIVVAYSNHETVPVLGEFDNETLTSQDTYSTAFESRLLLITVRDFNSDHYLNIPVTNSDSNNVDIFLRYIFKSFTTQTMYSTEKGSGRWFIVLGNQQR
ncbi:unnamed protein product [Rotaria sp. Silwood2]|nr:unnamed protein product [Rotaria sp. Silwood2]CAF3278198.1 unnamed protein product [Rotaria sp. Silwood2]CAF4155032.1 unnamed protein product [Rotaria sp. Silwood2]CAF4393770.1 unnamed protein product [Rotaria sp. Silwood2]CAF4649426.1 unnamed protein product [Rotaria sp. Silwood2]